MDKLYITNRTDTLMHAAICDDNTGYRLIAYELMPGMNELKINELVSGSYIIHLEDNEHKVVYEQKIMKD